MPKAPDAEPYGRILATARDEVASWGGQMHFVYLPDYGRYRHPAKVVPFKDDLSRSVGDLGIPTIDVAEAFEAVPDPLDLFPFRMQGHYLEAGYRLVAEAIARALDGQRERSTTPRWGARSPAEATGAVPWPAMGGREIVVFTVVGAALSPAAWAVAELELPGRLGSRTRLATTVALAVGGGVAAWRVEPALAATGTAVALAAAVTAAVVDVADLRIPNRVVLPALATSGALFAVQGVVGDGGAAVRALASAALFYGVLGVIHVVVPQAMGYGDVKLAALLGLPLGWQSWWGVPAGLMAASIGGILVHSLLVVARRRKWGDVLPFGVYLAIGATVTVALGGTTLGSALR